jgi:hypothetical protein
MIEAEKHQQVAVGTHVEVELIDEAGERERLVFDLVPDKQADFANGFLGESTPLAQAILGQTASCVVDYRVGDIVQVAILTVTPEARAPVEDGAAKRQAVIEQVVTESNRISDMVFALAVGSKWGDYDPGEPQA